MTALSQSGRRLSLAAAAAARCGVTRLADVTQLDCLGVPVFQAVRPWSRSLSIHQGKSLDPDEARLGALMEAVETYCAESFVGQQMVAAFTDLPAGMRAPELADFARDRAKPPADDAPFAWVQARVLGSEIPLWAPFDFVSLDFSRGTDNDFDRSSDGLACHFEPSSALTAGLLELLERDGLTAFQTAPPALRARTRIDLRSVEMPWLTSLREKLRAAEIHISVYLQSAVIAAPVFICELLEPKARGAMRGRVYGSACDPCVETALRKAVLEAVQSRLAAISGARDDFFNDVRDIGGATFGFAPPLPPHIEPIAWATIVRAFPYWRPTPHQIASRLTAVGYPICAAVDLSPPQDEVAVVKAIVPGLGSHHRCRRPTAGRSS